MEGDNFYLTLPSDSSLHRYPDNTGGDFTVVLPCTLHLSSLNWEVGLSEIIFSQDWFTLIAEDLWLGACINLDQGGTWGDWEYVMIDETRASKAYLNIKEFVDGAFKPLLLKLFEKLQIAATDSVDGAAAGDSFAYTLEEGKDGFAFSVNAVTPNKRPVRLQLSAAFLQIFGFSPNQLVEKRYMQTDAGLAIKSPSSAFPPKLTRAVTSLWIYSNIVRPQITGHMFTPLLRAVAVDSTVSNEVTRVVEFSKPHYIPLNTDDISEITLKIFNAAGRAPIPFATTVIVKLHFKRRKPWTVNIAATAASTSSLASRV